MYVKIESMRLRYLRDNQGTIRSELYQGLQDAAATGQTNAGTYASYLQFNFVVF